MWTLSFCKSGSVMAGLCCTLCFPCCFKSRIFAFDHHGGTSKGWVYSSVVQREIKVPFDTVSETQGESTFRSLRLFGFVPQRKTP
jgi:hypothetical protein